MSAESSAGAEMTLPRTAAEALSSHVVFELRSIDRMLVTLYQPRLQYGAGIRGFFCWHRGNRFVSSTLMHPMTEHFVADVHHYVATNNLDLVHFVKGQSKDDVAKGYLAGHDGSERILFVGRAQEKTAVWRTRQRRDAATGRPYPWLAKESAMVNHFYCYGFDDDFGPFHVKFASYFPFTAQLCLLTELRVELLGVTGQIPVRVATVPARDRIRGAVAGSQGVGGAWARSVAGERGSVRALPAG